MPSLTCERVWSDVSSEPPTGANSTVSPSAVHVKENGADLRCILLRLQGIGSLLAKTAGFVHTYVCKFTKHCAALLADLPEHHFVIWSCIYCILSKNLQVFIFFIHESC